MTRVSDIHFLRHENRGDKERARENPWRRAGNLVRRAKQNANHFEKTNQIETETVELGQEHMVERR